MGEGFDFGRWGGGRTFRRASGELAVGVLENPEQRRCTVIQGLGVQGYLAHKKHPAS